MCSRFINLNHIVFIRHNVIYQIANKSFPMQSAMSLAMASVIGASIELFGGPIFSNALKEASSSYFEVNIITAVNDSKSRLLSTLQENNMSYVNILISDAVNGGCLYGDIEYARVQFRWYVLLSLFSIVKILNNFQVSEWGVVDENASMSIFGTDDGGGYITDDYGLLPRHSTDLRIEILLALVVGSLTVALLLIYLSVKCYLYSFQNRNLATPIPAQDAPGVAELSSLSLRFESNGNAAAASTTTDKGSGRHNCSYDHRDRQQIRTPLGTSENNFDIYYESSVFI